ncbi:MAG: hypothetical protein M3134_08030, partial [Actinomycetota bacterium]|nr:hypothetical protein [Actinomycetota bacterium]
APQAGHDAVSARAAEDGTPAAPAEDAAGSSRSSTRRSGTTGRASSAPSSPTSPGKPKSGSPATSDAEVTPLLATVTDPASDADGDAPGFVEIAGATVEGAGSILTLTTTVAETVPQELAPGEVAIFAFEVSVAEADVTVVAQVDHGGTKAELSRDGKVVPLEHEVAGRDVRIFVPWRLLGSDRPSFDWTAGTALLEVSAEGMSSRGGDSAEQSSFPPSS